MAESSFELVFVSPNIAKILLKDLYDEQRVQGQARPEVRAGHG